jgi:hypothetical protein
VWYPKKPKNIFKLLTKGLARRLPELRRALTLRAWYGAYLPASLGLGAVPISPWASVLSSAFLMMLHS